MKPKKKLPTTVLNNPNDPSPGLCYAPVDKNKNVILKMKKHFKVGIDPPRGWLQVPCETGCRG